MSAASFGGLGGIEGGREVNISDDFEMAVTRAFGARMSHDDELCRAIWGSLANVEWTRRSDGAAVGYSFRAAGDLIAAIRGSGDYMEWYCSGPYGVINFDFAEAMTKQGWFPEGWFSEVLK